MVTQDPVTTGASGKDPDAGAVVHSRVYRHGALVAENLPVAELERYRRDTDAVVWLDLLAPTPTEFAAIAPAIGGDVEVNRIALESAMSNRGRPRLMRFADHRIVHLRAASFDAATRRLSTTDVAVLLFERELVTIRSGPGFPIAEVLDECDDNPELAGHGVPFLLFTLLDQMVEGYLDALDDLDEQILAVEDDLLDGSGPGREVQVNTFTLRRAVAALARVVLPTSEVLAVIGRGGAHQAAPEIQTYLQDVYEHAIRASERIDGQRDSIESILATSLSMQGNSLNEIMKKLTAWAAIIAIPTGITGYFGQNVPFPGYGDKFGFWLSAALLLALGGGLYIMFRRRDWL
ncbi:magnesium transporter CorA family protein [Aldersonia sp. NBC_00410]|uniref:magnesium transporter CorA family protein n=1 Tax=Aldersonia sp. NBC_00410 TaxID=2975954 RepID=UPI0022507FE3|nr:magnesium transporter CorA family protein [Aldersonia sp. NBC_00410]MCX5043462.1 magnesium transporter CorA family protein [Aldersonia sp. NBC_00410]